MGFVFALRAVLSSNIVNGILYLIFSLESSLLNVELYVCSILFLPSLSETSFY